MKMHLQDRFKGSFKEDSKEHKQLMSALDGLLYSHTKQHFDKAEKTYRTLAKKAAKIQAKGDKAKKKKKEAVNAYCEEGAAGAVEVDNAAR
ncbi:hypothetical protein EC973_006324, partial [Apophysomyces ossiformis]